MKSLLFVFCFFIFIPIFTQNKRDLSPAQKAYAERLGNLFNVKIKLGQSWAKVRVLYEESTLRDDNKSVEFNKESSIRFGLEVEHMFEFSNKWSVFAEPTYDSYNSVAEIPSAIDPANLTSVQIDYSFIEVPIGIRHHMYFGRSKVFVNMALVFVLDLNTDIDYEEVFEFENDLEINSDINLALGFGYSFNERVSLEYRFGTSRNILSQYASYKGPFKNSSLILGFRLF